MDELLRKLLELSKQGKPCAFVKITASSGSVPRGIGASMLVGTGSPAEGLVAGTIGGGMVEFRAIQEAQKAIEAKMSESKSYILHQNEIEDLGMICGGNVTVQITYLPPGKIADDFAKACLAQYEAETARALIFGGGHCGQELARILPHLGWQTVVVDDREEFTRQELFPNCTPVHCDFQKLSENVALKPTDYIIVLTRGHAADFECVNFALKSEEALKVVLPYIGCIGSRTKIASVNRRLEEAGRGKEAIARVHAPIGLMLGGRTPEEIAIEIAGQMIETRSKINPRY
jgi:xanthine dehydrogenase accessory factor